jgi:hypothetical protein
MFVILFPISVIIAILGLFGELVMRIRVAKREPYDRIAWWRRGGDEVVAAYQELFPNSQLPILRRFCFWLVLVSAAIVLFVALLKSH